MTTAATQALATALSDAVGLPIRPEDMPGVALNLERLLAQARLLDCVGLDHHAEPAPLFHHPSPAA